MDQYGRRPDAAARRMSGLCGWLSSAPMAIGIERMAAPICRFERTPLKSATHGAGAAALVGSIDCTSLLHEDGLIVALWGNPGQDVHLLAQRWRSHGPWACSTLTGQFAFAILDERSGEGLLAVDRFATRPLYYQSCGDSLIFASTQDALLRHPLAGRDVAAQALYQYLVLGAMHGSAWEGQQQLGPGECVHLRSGRGVRHTWWRMRFHEHADIHADGHCTGLGAALQQVLADAGGDQQTGVMLSGGVASTTLAMLLQEQDTGCREPVPTFSVAYAGASSADPAREVVKLLGGRRHDRQQYHHHQVVAPSDLVDAIPRLAALSDRPCGDSDAVGHYYCALLARGQGTLRLFSGAGLLNLFGAGPLALPRPGLAAWLWAHWQQWSRPADARYAERDFPAQLVQASPFYTAGLAPGFMAQLQDGRGGCDAPLALLRNWWWSAQCRSATNRAISLDVRQSLAPRLAASQLGCGLAGVDVAFPFLDETVLDCAAHTDPRQKHRGHWSAHARTLRDLASGVPQRRAPATTLPLAA
ncbi:MAG: asparagine synthase-related protein [Pseudomonadota bacterium]|nr:asparagine synthase-related protein [Pseudomonadota bacterium]